MGAAKPMSAKASKLAEPKNEDKDCIAQASIPVRLDSPLPDLTHRRRHWKSHVSLTISLSFLHEELIMNPRSWSCSLLLVISSVMRTTGGQRWFLCYHCVQVGCRGLVVRAVYLGGGGVCLFFFSKAQESCASLY
jgi:hypothetical protein